MSLLYLWHNWRNSQRKTKSHIRRLFSNLMWNLMAFNAEIQNHLRCMTTMYLRGTIILAKLSFLYLCLGRWRWWWFDEYDVDFLDNGDDCQVSEEVCLTLKSGECSVLQRKEQDGGLGTVTLRVLMMMMTMMMMMMSMMMIMILMTMMMMMTLMMMISIAGWLTATLRVRMLCPYFFLI